MKSSYESYRGKEKVSANGDTGGFVVAPVLPCTARNDSLWPVVNKGLLSDRCTHSLTRGKRPRIPHPQPPLQVWRGGSELPFPILGEGAGGWGGLPMEATTTGRDTTLPRVSDYFRIDG